MYLGIFLGYVVLSLYRNLILQLPANPKQHLMQISLFQGVMEMATAFWLQGSILNWQWFNAARNEAYNISAEEVFIGPKVINKIYVGYNTAFSWTKVSDCRTVAPVVPQSCCTSTTIFPIECSTCLSGSTVTTVLRSHKICWITKSMTKLTLVLCTLGEPVINLMKIMETTRSGSDQLTKRPDQYLENWIWNV